MPEFAYDQNRQTGNNDRNRWAYETALLLDYHAPNPQAAHGTAAHKGYGCPPHWRCPPDCYDYIAGSFKRDMAKIRQDQPLSPDIKFALIACTTAYFAWLRSKQGTQYLLKLHGIDILSPHPGFVYYYKEQALVEPNFGLRIYQRDRMQRTGLSPVEYSNRSLIPNLKKILEEIRGPSHTQFPCPAEGMWNWVASQLRNWLIEAHADTSWPYTKPDRLTGYQWARNAIVGGTQNERQWNIFEEIERFERKVSSTSNERCYRIQSPAYEARIVNGQEVRVAPANPGRLWVGRHDMRVIPIDQFEKELYRQAGRDPNQVDERYRCGSCGRVMPCTNGGPNDRLCYHCRGVQLETGDRPALRYCIRYECKSCPEQLRSHDELDNMINRLNSERTNRQR